MITHGWTWAQSAWSICHEDEAQGVGGLGSSDGEGWTYASNFGSIEDSGTAAKGMTHFVRRRRRTRKQIFVGEPNESEEEKHRNISLSWIHVR